MSVPILFRAPGRRAIAYLDLPTGCSVEMLLGCLVDVGWPVERVRAAIGALNLPASHWAVVVETVMKGQLRATGAEVMIDEGPGRLTPDDCRALIDAADVPAAVRHFSASAFTRWSVGPSSETRPMEAAALTVACVAGLHELGVERLYSSVPSPDLTTPVAAALLAELTTFEQPAIRLSRIGIGAGARDLPRPNVARIWLGDAEVALRGETEKALPFKGDSTAAGLARCGPDEPARLRPWK